MIQLRFSAVQIGIGASDDRQLPHRLVLHDPDSKIGVVCELDDNALQHLRGQIEERGAVTVVRPTMIVPGHRNGG